MIHVERLAPEGVDVAICWQAVVGRHAPVDEVCGWLGDNRERFESDMREHGAVLLRGFQGARSAADFEAMLRALDQPLRDYVGGTSPRRHVAGKIMTATDAPGSFSIPLHQEMSYTATLPARISFFGQRPSNEAGETTLGNVQRLSKRLDGDLVDRFSHRGLQLRRNLPLPEQVATRPGVPKPWTQVFETDDREQADALARKKGWRTEWQPDGSVTLWQEVLPALRRHPVTGEELWCNQLHIFAPVAALRWALNDGRVEFANRLAEGRVRRPELLDDVLYGDGSPVSDDDAIAVARVIDEAALPHRWQPGDVLVLDNLRVAHGRRQFRGERSILTALIGELPLQRPPESSVPNPVAADHGD